MQLDVNVERLLLNRGRASGNSDLATPVRRRRRANSNIYLYPFADAGDAEASAETSIIDQQGQRQTVVRMM